MYLDEVHDEKSRPTVSFEELSDDVLDDVVGGGTLQLSLGGGCGGLNTT